MTKSSRITTIIIDLESQEVPNISSTTEKHHVARKTLEDQWKGISVSREEANSTYRQCLTNAQEKALVQLINKLTDRKLPPTTTIVRNLVEEIRGARIRKNQLASFIARYKNELKSAYLKTIDNKRVKGEFPTNYQTFYQLVEYFFILFLELYILRVSLTATFNSSRKRLKNTILQPRIYIMLMRRDS